MTVKPATQPINLSYMVSKLSHLIQEKQVQQIHIYRFDGDRLYAQSSDWSFGHEFIQVGGQSFNLNRVVTFKIVDQILQLYF